MSKIAEELNTYIKMVSGDNLVKEKQSHQSIHDILQDHPKEVALFKRSPEQFDFNKHKEFYQDLFDLYSDSGEMPHEVVKASSERYKAQWVWDKLHDEISGQDEVDPHGEAPYDDFDMDLEYNDDNDWGQYEISVTVENDKGGKDFIVAAIQVENIDGDLENAFLR